MFLIQQNMKKKKMFSTVETINKVWIKRWLGRTSNEEILDQLKTLGKDTVSSSVNFPISENDLPLFKVNNKWGRKCKNLKSGKNMRSLPPLFKLQESKHTFL